VILVVLCTVAFGLSLWLMPSGGRPPALSVLFSLLAFTGIGSLASGRLGEPRRALTLALGGGCLLIAAAAFGPQPLLRELIEWPFEARVALTVLLLAPAGVALGMAMPIGLPRLARLHPDAVPWAWAVNGIASALADALRGPWPVQRA
jgi:hypothetical protein